MVAVKYNIMIVYCKYKGIYFSLNYVLFTSFEPWCNCRTRSGKTPLECWHWSVLFGIIGFI